jgi:hypothetical protein
MLIAVNVYFEGCLGKQIALNEDLMKKGGLARISHLFQRTEGAACVGRESNHHKRTA